MGRRKKKKELLDYVAIPQLEISDEAKKGIMFLLIAGLGVVSFLGLFNLAGSLGEVLAKGQEISFGWGKWIFPFALISWAFFLYKKDETYFRGSSILGLFLFFISFQSFLHFFLPREDWDVLVQDGVGGGHVGNFLANIFMNILGFWGGIVGLSIITVIAVMLIFNTSLTKILGGESIFAKIFYPFTALFGAIFSKREYEEEEESADAEAMADEEEEEEIEEEVEELEAKPAFSKKEIHDEEEIEEIFQEKLNRKASRKKGQDGDRWKTKNINIDLPMDLLDSNNSKPTSGDIKNNALVIQRTLENFGISVEMHETSVGPTVTQFSFKPAEGVKLSRITTLSNDLALSLAAHPIRIEAPIPGKALVGVEVPNKTKAMVGLKEILESKEFKTRKNNLTIALGRDVAGKSWTYDVTRMPHALVAGATNSGKSVCLNTIILSLLYQNNPDDLRFIMVDPKRVELTVYDGIPHLLTPVITNVPKTVNALKWCLNEMDRRFELLAKNKKRNIQSYNQRLKKGEEKMPYIVFVIDELADLMVTAGKEIEGSIIRLAQMARAVGIHLILATQRPSVDVITGLIKANMPSRVAFSVASSTDSKTILDSTGAEKLLGKGDMLFVTAEISKPKRVQGAYVSDDEIKKIIDYIKEKSGEVEYVEGVTDKQKVGGFAGAGMEGGGGGDVDDLFDEAKSIILEMGKASASLLQRRLSIGYARAARIMDELEENGIIGPSNGAKPREILITKEDNQRMESQGIAGVPVHNRDEAEAPESYLGGDNSLGEASGDDATVFKSEEDNEDESDDDEDIEDEEEIEEDEEIEEEEIEEEEVEETEEEIDEEDEPRKIASLSRGEEDVEEEESADAEDMEDEKKNDEEKINKKAKDDFDEDDGMFFAR